MTFHYSSRSNSEPQLFHVAGRDLLGDVKPPKGTQGLISGD